MVVLGTRPEAIKLAPVIRALRQRGMAVRVCTTAQHRDLLDQWLEGESLRIDIDLDLMRAGQNLATFTARAMAALDRVFGVDEPDRVIVQGDTATALAAAQAAFLRGIPVAHVEAGLRTGDPRQPWPEESIRRSIALWADLHFAPSARSAAALRDEGIDPARVHMTGNTIVDACQAERSRALHVHPVVQQLMAKAGSRRVVLVTCHRRENIGSGVDGIAAALRDLAQRADVFAVLPAHPNPSFRNSLAQALAGAVALIEPLPFGPFLQLLEAAHNVLTDSGGVQEEAPLLGTPVLVAREVTERPEGVEAGTARLVGTCPRTILNEAVRLLDDPLHHARMARRHSPYGDGRAAERIAAIIAREHAPAIARASGE
jgi:UDP-N-acetylglucosamine 2-epimerase (non-hydrolysing)